jgi:hypothetical protein
MADTMKRQLTGLERFLLLYNIGGDYAGHGNGLFPVYDSVQAAFDKAKQFPYYVSLNFTDSDFQAFEAGYNTVKRVFRKAWEAKQKAQADIKQILADVDYKSESYVYDKSKPAPYLYGLGCLNQGCGQEYDKCKCSHFKPTRNPEFKGVYAE